MDQNVWSGRWLDRKHHFSKAHHVQLPVVLQHLCNVSVAQLWSLVSIMCFSFFFISSNRFQCQCFLICSLLRYQRGCEISHWKKPQCAFFWVFIAFFKSFCWHTKHFCLQKNKKRQITPVKIGVVCVDDLTFILVSSGWILRREWCFCVHWHLQQSFLFNTTTGSQ